MSEHVYFLTLGLFLGTIVVVFAMRYISAVKQARARLDSAEAYRALAEKAAAAQAEAAASLAAIQAALADATSRAAASMAAVHAAQADAAARLAAVEKILKDVG